MQQTRREFMRAGTIGLAALSASDYALSLSQAASVGKPRGETKDARRREGIPIKGPIFNQDDTEFFVTHPAAAMNAETIDRWVDGLADVGVGTLMSCVAAMRTNYPSKVWEPQWHGYDPDGPNDQPVLRHLPRESIPATRRRLDSAMKLAELGINFHQRAFQRCRSHGIGCWISIRMNDLHDCHLPDSPLLSTFYKHQRDLGHVRVPYRFGGWPDRALDWLCPEVRDHYMRLIAEVLRMYDLDGLELDWMRFGYHFPIGRELEGGKILTEFIEAVRRECGRAGERLGHPVKLGVRVPSIPETARNLGMDGATWAREGLIDLLVPTPFWATCEFNMPMKTWRRLLRGTDVVLAGGLEVRYQPTRGGWHGPVTPELAAGAATAVLAGEADVVYLFNYFRFDPKTIAAMRSLDSLTRLPRRHALTYRDTLAPGEPHDDPLPASGNLLQFRLQTGPKPSGRKVQLLLQLADDSKPPPTVRVNSIPCPEPQTEEPVILVYPVPEEALADEVHVIEVTRGPVQVVRVEFAIGAPAS